METLSIVEEIEAKLDTIMRRSEELHAQIARLVKERQALRDAMVAAEFHLEDYEDVEDGPEGQQLPNPAMKALIEIRRALYG